jgi:ribose 5-phosphate isomerase B
MTVYFGTDHAGFKLKEALKKYVASLGHQVIDLGAIRFDGDDDYPDFIIPAARAAVKNNARAIVLGGSGVGECIAANKVKGARAAMAFDAYTAKMSRTDTDCNVLCLGGRTSVSKLATAKKIVRVWLATRFSGAARHQRRLRKIVSFEKGSRYKVQGT